MTKNEIATQLKTFLEAELYNQAVVLTETTNLLEDWFVDSLAIVQLALFVETRFGVSMTRADINGANFRSIETLSELVLARRTA